MTDYCIHEVERSLCPHCSISIAMNSPTNEEIASEAFWGDAASVEEVCGKDAVERIKAALDEKDRIKDALLVQHDVWKKSSEELEKSLAQKDQLLREVDGALRFLGHFIVRPVETAAEDDGISVWIEKESILKAQSILSKLKKELNP